MKKRSDDIKKLLQKLENGTLDNEFNLEIQEIISEEKSELLEFQLLDNLKGRRDLLESAPENLFEKTMKQIENKELRKKQLPLSFNLVGKRILLGSTIALVLILSIFSFINYDNETNENTVYIFKFRQLFELPFELWIMTLFFASFIYLDRVLNKREAFSI